MSLTTEQRAEISRNNAKKSTGPKTAEGKANSRKNALKHGMRAQVLALPNEDPEAIAARSDEWFDYYKPQSPAAKQLVNECVRATILSDRVATFHDNILAGQVRNAVRDWDVAHEGQAVDLNERFDTNPVEARKELLRTTHGRHMMIVRWKSLRETLKTQGYLDDPQADEAVYLLGATLDLDVLQRNPTAYNAFLYNHIAHKDSKDVEIALLLTPKYVPDACKRQQETEPFPDRESARAALLAIVEAEIASHYDAKRELNEKYDMPERLEAEACAMIIRDEKIAKNYLRYQAEARNGFHKALGRLMKTLESDAESGSTREDVPPNEAVSMILSVESEKIVEEPHVEKLRNEPTERASIGIFPMAVFLMFLVIFSQFAIPVGWALPTVVATSPGVVDEPNRAEVDRSAGSTLEARWAVPTLRMENPTL